MSDEQHSTELVIDADIAPAVRVLREHGVETFDSCQGGSGHPCPDPMVRFHGDRAEGFRALGVALSAGLSVLELRRTWPVIEGEPTGPCWELAFRSAGPDDLCSSFGAQPVHTDHYT